MVLPYSPPATLSRLIRVIDLAPLPDTDREAEWIDLLALRMALNRLEDPFTPWNELWDDFSAGSFTTSLRNARAILFRARHLVEHPAELATELRLRMGTVPLSAFANFAASNLSKE